MHAKIRQANRRKTYFSAPVKKKTARKKRKNQFGGATPEQVKRAIDRAAKKLEGRFKG